MRPLVFPPGTHRSTMKVISAIAWATNRRGRVGWKSDNVTRTIHQYLVEHHIDVSTAQISNGLTWLDRQGYVTRKFDPNHTRTLELRFHDDVILSGFSPEFNRRRTTQVPKLLSLPLIDQERKPHPVTELKAALKESILTGAAVPEYVEPPLPFAEEDATDLIYRWDEFQRVAAAWWLRDPEGWSNWVDRVIERLERAAEEGKETD